MDGRVIAVISISFLLVLGIGIVSPVKAWCPCNMLRYIQMNITQVFGKFNGFTPASNNTTIHIYLRSFALKGYIEIGSPPPAYYEYVMNDSNVNDTNWTQCDYFVLSNKTVGWNDFLITVDGPDIKLVNPRGQVLSEIVDPNFWNDTQSNLQDLRFSNKSVEIQYYYWENRSIEKAVVLLRIPAYTQNIYMYYGNPSCSMSKWLNDTIFNFTKPSVKSSITYQMSKDGVGWELTSERVSAENVLEKASVSGEIQTGATLSTTPVCLWYTTVSWSVISWKNPYPYVLNVAANNSTIDIVVPCSEVYSSVEYISKTFTFKVAHPSEYGGIVPQPPYPTETWIVWDESSKSRTVEIAQGINEVGVLTLYNHTSVIIPKLSYSIETNGGNVGASSSHLFHGYTIMEPMKLYLISFIPQWNSSMDNITAAGIHVPSSANATVILPDGTVKHVHFGFGHPAVVPVGMLSMGDHEIMINATNLTLIPVSIKMDVGSQQMIPKGFTYHPPMSKAIFEFMQDIPSMSQWKTLDDGMEISGCVMKVKSIVPCTVKIFDFAPYAIKYEKDRSKVEVANLSITTDYHHVNITVVLTNMTPNTTFEIIRNGKKWKEVKSNATGVVNFTDNEFCTNYYVLDAVLSAGTSTTTSTSTGTSNTPIGAPPPPPPPIPVPKYTITGVAVIAVGATGVIFAALLARRRLKGKR